MTARLVIVLLASSTLAPFGASPAEEPVDLAMVTRIREEGLHHSKAMETLAQLTEVVGPRLTGSPHAREANEWTRRQLESWGLASARLEEWGPFGRGWTCEHASVRMVGQTPGDLIAVPKAWTPGTDGPRRGRAIKVRLETLADLDLNKGSLEGSVVLVAPARELPARQRPTISRYTAEQLEELSRFEKTEIRPRVDAPRERQAELHRHRFAKALREFVVAEKVLAVVEPSERDGGIVRVTEGGSRDAADSPGVPALVIAAEHYNRVLRLLDRGIPVQLEVDVRARFLDSDLMAYNTLAEIPGSERGGEVVMLGAHLDSWHGGTGATDNAAGVSVAMEAMRILKVLGVRPQRTIRIALWTGEEQGLLGSRAHVSRYFAARPEPVDTQERSLPSYLRGSAGPLALKPPHALFSAYFNVDNGAGRIRGIYTQGNVAAAPIFAAWLRPLADLGATTVSNRSVGSTDHIAFDEVGLPGFQFIQDDADYSTRTHHTNMDVYDRVQPEDIAQASVVLATLAYHAATRSDRFPRKALPREPTSSLAPQPGG